MLLAAMFCHCGSDPIRAHRTTRASRELMVVTRHPHADAYFAAVYGHQHALGAIDARRAELLAGLARAVGLLPNAERPDVITAMRAAIERAGATRVRVRFDPVSTAAAVARVEAWYGALNAAGGEREVAAAIDARYGEIVESIRVTVEPDAGGEALAPLFEAATRVLRDAEATRRCMEALTRDPSPALSGESAARAEAPSFAAEFDAARTFTRGIRARATLHAQDSAGTERWVINALTPERREAEPDEEEEENQPPGDQSLRESGLPSTSRPTVAVNRRASMGYTGAERRIHRVYVTRNTEYHVRGSVCVGVRDLRNAAWCEAHPAIGRVLEGALRYQGSGVLPVLDEPRVGDAIYFRNGERDLVTSRVQRIERPHLEVVRGYRA